MVLRRIAAGTVVLASLLAGMGIDARHADAGCRGRRCTTTLCFDGGCCYSNPPYSNGNPYESGSGNFWGVHYYCRQYANRCNSPCGPGNTPFVVGAPPVVRAPAPTTPAAPPPPVEAKQPAQPPVPKPVE
jgi:hypothetical protein